MQVTGGDLIPYQAAHDKAAHTVIDESLQRWRAQPCIVYLKGTSSAGKSTFGGMLEKHFNDWVFIDEDLIYLRLSRDEVAKRLPHEYAIIARAIAPQNLYHAFYRKEVLFQKDARESDCKAASVALKKVQSEVDNPSNAAWKEAVKAHIRKEVLDKIQAAFQNQKKVFLDCWFYTADQIQEHFKAARVIRLLLYCPLPITFQRWQKRNSEGYKAHDISTTRYLGQVVISFCRLYKVSKTPMQPIESIAKKAFDEQFTVMEEEIRKAHLPDPKKSFMPLEVTVEAFQKHRAQFMQPYEKENADALFVEPQAAHDHIMNSALDVRAALDFLTKWL